MLAWYVIQTKPRKENEVEIHLGKAGLEVLNAKIRSFSSGLRPLFPNYIFLRWDLSLAHNHHMVKYTRGVNKILGSLATPVPLSDEVIDVIKERVNPQNVLEQNIMKEGSRVKIRKGLLKNLVGVLTKSVSADGRVAVLLRIHDREMKAMLACKDVALIA